MTDPEIVVRPAGLGDVDALWPLERDVPTSFLPVRDAFEETLPAILALGYEEPATFFKPAL